MTNELEIELQRNYCSYDLMKDSCISITSRNKTPKKVFDALSSDHT